MRLAHPSAHYPVDPEFLVELRTVVPDGTPAAVEADARRREAVRMAELSTAGHVIRLWRTSDHDGEFPIGLWRSADATLLQRLLDSLPLAPWMTTAIHPLMDTSTIRLGDADDAQRRDGSGRRIRFGRRQTVIASTGATRWHAKSSWRERRNPLRTRGMMAADSVSYVQRSVANIGGLTELLPAFGVGSMRNVAVMPHSFYDGPGLLAPCVPPPYLAGQTPPWSGDTSTWRPFITGTT